MTCWGGFGGEVGAGTVDAMGVTVRGELQAA